MPALFILFLFFPPETDSTWSTHIDVNTITAHIQYTHPHTITHALEADYIRLLISVAKRMYVFQSTQPVKNSLSHTHTHTHTLK